MLIYRCNNQYMPGLQLSIGNNVLSIVYFRLSLLGAIAQLARASRWQREGPGFESP